MPRFVGGLLACLLLGLCLPAAALMQPTAVPVLQHRCTDLAGLLAPRDAARIERTLKAYAKRSGHQFAVLIVPRIQDDTAEAYAVRVFETWKLGKAGRDDGLLLLINTDPADRQMRIEVGYGLEGSIPDAVAHRVIDSHLVPAFKAGHFARGIDAGLRALMQAAGDDAAAAEDDEVPEDAASKPSAWRYILLPFLGIWALLFGRGRKGRGGGGWLGPPGGGGFGGGGGAGGGGGFGGDGGRSGGGGASGRW